PNPCHERRTGIVKTGNPRTSTGGVKEGLLSKIKNLHRMTYKLTGMMPQLQLAWVGTPYTPSGEPGKAEKPGIVSAAAALGGAAAAAALQSAAERLRAMPHTPELARAGKAVSGWLGGLRRKVYAVDADPANHCK